MITLDLLSLRGRGWCVIGSSVAVVRLKDRKGSAVGVQDSMRGGGTGRVWASLKKARRRATELASMHRLPIVEAL